MYDICPDERHALSTNFARLERLRPGYGYSNSADTTEGVLSPEDDGLFLINLDTYEKKLLISYATLDKLLFADNKGESYINHISISPNGDKAMFFYIYNYSDKPGWKATLWVVDLNTAKYVNN